MSTLVAQTISNGTVSTSSANVIQGSAKAWATFSGTDGSTTTSYNVSSTTRTGTGAYTVNLTNSMPNANYCIQATCRENVGTANLVSVRFDTTPTASSFSLRSTNINGPSVDVETLYVAVFSS
jgi:hypothetical protein